MKIEYLECFRIYKENAKCPDSVALDAGIWSGLRFPDISI